MEFCGRYQLLDLVHQEDGIKSFEAFDVQTNGPVQVHIFERTGTNTASIVKSITQEARERIIEQGSEKGNTYFVTGELPAGISFREWLLNPVVVVPELLDQSPATRPRKSSRKKTSNAGLDVGKFSRMFQSSPASESQTAPVQQQSGEFSRMFQSVPAAHALPPSVLATRSKTDQGEFSRMFQGTRVDEDPSLALPSAGESPVAPAATQSKLEELEPEALSDHPGGEYIQSSQAQIQEIDHAEFDGSRAPLANGHADEPTQSLLSAADVVGHSLENPEVAEMLFSVSEPNIQMLSREIESAPLAAPSAQNELAVAGPSLKHNPREVIHVGPAYAATPSKSTIDKESLEWLLRPDPAPRSSNVPLFFGLTALLILAILILILMAVRI